MLESTAVGAKYTLREAITQGDNGFELSGVANKLLFPRGTLQAVDLEGFWRRRGCRGWDGSRSAGLINLDKGALRNRFDRYCLL